MAKIEKIQKRRRAREIVMQMCYLFDIKRVEEPEKAMNLFEVILLEQKLESDEYVIEYARELVNGIVKNRIEIDGLIRMNMTGWRPERIGIIDRVAIFLALYEGIVGCKVDVPVAISEAVNLAGLFGSDESSRFVNGVLGKIVRVIETSGAKSNLPSVNGDSHPEKD